MPTVSNGRTSAKFFFRHCRITCSGAYLLSPSSTSSLVHPSATSTVRSSTTGPLTGSPAPSSATVSSGRTSLGSTSDVAVSTLPLLGHGPLSDEHRLQQIFYFVSRSRRRDLAFMIELADENEYQYFNRVAFISKFRYAFVFFATTNSKIPPPLPTEMPGFRNFWFMSNQTSMQTR